MRIVATLVLTVAAIWAFAAPMHSFAAEVRPLIAVSKTDRAGVRACLRALVPLDQDSMPRSDAFAPAACPANLGPRAYLYDASSGVTRLARAIATGEIVPRFLEYGSEKALPGDRLALVVVIGHIRIERDVEALQAAGPGQKLFVKDKDGQVLSVRYERAVQ